MEIFCTAMQRRRAHAFPQGNAQRHQARQRVHHRHGRGEAGGPGARTLLQLQNHRRTFLSGNALLHVS
uniref:Uncharacterized protein n=1 Tax=Anguilla anguilla TaxID=7936 RepID=A0A0E9UYV7_ANGAN